MSDLVLQPGRVHLRHISDVTGPAAVDVLGRAFAPAPTEGVNGPGAFLSGQTDARRQEEGTMTVTFPNAAGSDGRLHRDRFLILQKGRRTPAVDGSGAVIYEGGNYRPGDEWVELYRAEDPARMVTTPVSARITRQTVELSLVDAYWLLRKSRETAAGFWCHAPRDALEHYSQIWQTVISDDFAGQAFIFDNATERTTTDGRWRYKGAENVAGESVCQLRDPTGVNAAKYLAPSAAHGIPLGLACSEPHTAWRAECELVLPSLSRDGVGGGVGGPAASTQFAMVEAADLVNGAVGVAIDLTQDYSTASGGGASIAVQSKTATGAIKLALEGRDRWVHVYVNGALAGTLPMPAGSASSLYVPRVLISGSDDAELAVKVRNLWARRTRPFLMRGADKGDYRLPGKPTPGGLIGAYYSDAGLAKHGTDSYRYHFAPGHEPLARRLDPRPDLALTNRPTGLSEERISVRWTGAIYLDLANYDYRLRTTSDDRARVWVAKTRFGEQITDDWPATDPGNETVTSGYLRALLGQQSGWYPIRVEYMNQLGSGSFALTIEDSTNPGVFTAVLPARLSPSGIFEEFVRHESHYDQHQAVAAQFGYQFRCEPRSLESGLFPGECVPRIRVGRDTAYVLDHVEAREIATDISAEDAADVLLADAAGIAAEGAQLSAELIDYAQVGEHLLIHYEYESAPETTIEALFLQRLDSLLTLRGGTWEQITAQPKGFSRLVDRFPLTGLPAEIREFAWEPGDGARLHLPELGVTDDHPRQIMGVVRPFVPDGLGVPSVAWRQRQRSGKQLLRQMLKEPLKQSRNYQGQLAAVSGGVHAAGDSDAYTRVNLPEDLTKVIRAEFVVQQKADTSPKTIEVNGVARGTFTAVGRYDITPYVSRRPDGDGPSMYARATGGTSDAEYQLELLVAV